MNRPLLLILLLIFLLGGGCAGKELWYRVGHGQEEFDRDYGHCRELAAEAGREATLSGRRADPATYINTIHGCLNGLGWSRNPPLESADDGQPGDYPPLAELGSGGLRGFGKIIAPPPEFKLQAEERNNSGTTSSHTFSFSDPDGSVLNVLFQRTATDFFQPINYPVREPFFLYEQGGEKGRAPGPWAIFAGEYQQTPLLGFGTYILPSKRQRITVVVITTLPPAGTPPPRGLRLSADHYQAAEEFRKRWPHWLAKAITNSGMKP